MNFMLRKFMAFLCLLPGLILLILGAYNAGLTLLAQIFSDFVDFRNFSLINLFTPYTSVGGSGTFIDSIVAGPGASGGSAVRYWIYMSYALMCAVGYSITKICWEIIKTKNE